MIKTNIFKVITLVFATIVASTSLMAQTPSFDKTIHDFGEIIETDGDVTYSFRVTNSGTTPLVISAVSASCGCTTPGWTREPIAAGASGEVKATYNPIRRPGKFDKTLTVTTNGTPNRTVLRIQGNVVRKPADLRVEFPDSIGGLRLKSKNIDLGMGSEDVPVVYTIETANAQDNPVTFSVENVPSFMKVQLEPATLQPKQKGVIRVIINGAGKAPGYYNQNLNVKVGSTTGAIQTSGLIRNTFAKGATPDQLPKFVVQKNNFDFSSTQKGKTVVATYDITNDGATELVITNITSNSPTVKSAVKNLKIKPGKSAQVKVNYQASKEGANDVTLYVATNDPNNALASLTIKGTVTK